MTRAVFQSYAQDSEGNVLPNASVTVIDEDSGSPVSLFNAYSGGSSLSNPFTADANGFFVFYADPARVKITVILGGDTSEFRNVRLSGTAAQADIVGTVSESGGVPTGAIIETGTNANGTYTRYADGTMICRKKSQAVTSSAIGIISEFSEVWPVAFIDATYVVSFMQATAHGDPLASSAVIGQSISGRDLQFCFFAGHSMFQSAIPYQFDLTAIGRWF